MSSNNKVVLLTGSSRGLGREAAKQIAARNEPITLLATSRGAVDLKLEGAHPSTIIEYPQLDILDADSISCLAKDVRAKYGRVDVLINNAGSTFEEIDNSTFGPEVIRKTFDLNTRGFRPSDSAGGRVVNLSSAASQACGFDNAELKAKLFDSKTNLKELNALAKEYEAASLSGDDTDGWLRTGFYPAYSTSKAFVNLLTAAAARVHPDIIVNSVCPGVCTTSLADPLPPTFKQKTAAEGAQLIMQLAFDDLNGTTGKFWSGVTTAATTPGIVTDNWAGKEIPWDYVTVA